MTKNLEKIPVTLESQACRELEEGSMLLVDCKSSDYRLLNSTGSFLWKQIDGKRSLADLAQLLTEEFEVSMEQALKDSETFLNVMEEKKAVSWEK